MRRFLTVLALILSMNLLQPFRADAVVKHTVWFYGDSILGESTARLDVELSNTYWNKTYKAHYGKTLCDFKQEIVDDIIAGPAPDVIAVEIEGNNTACMGGFDPSSQEWIDLMAVDMAEVASHVPPGTNFHFAIGPAGSGVWQVRHDSLVMALYQANVPFTRDPDVAVAPSGYTDYLPCLSTEGPAKGCLSGQIRVRNMDGVHMCPVPFSATCPSYSSGEFRFSKAWATHVKNSV